MFHIVFYKTVKYKIIYIIFDATRIEMKNLKEELFNKCKQIVASKLATITQIIESNQNALQSETKSSAGDKHETGRAMLQLEIEQTSQQFKSISEMNEILQKINMGTNHTIAKLGSLIQTSLGTYFLAISVGKIEFSGKTYFVVSPSSPIGKLILGKSKGDTFQFNGNKIEVIEIG